VAGPFEFLDRGCETSCWKTLQCGCHCQSFASTEDIISSRNHIMILCFDISVDTFSGLCSNVSYLGHFKNHLTELD